MSFLLLLWCAVLTAVPCCAFDGCEDEVQTEQSGHSDDQDDGCGSCSPFFACHGCSGFVVEERVQFSNAVLTQHLMEYVVREAGKRAGAFVVVPWQPPRLRA